MLAMKIYAYQAPRANLGDDLNHWLWPRLLRPAFLARPGVFMGIGSVIHPDHLQKISGSEPLYIFGAGCRSGENPFEGRDVNKRICMVRGPLSAKALEIEPDRAGLDAAYCLQFTADYARLRSLPKRHEMTLIPYFRSGPLVNYDWVAARRGWQILRSDDYGSIDRALQTIAESRYVLTESLHGAILADVLRVPWRRLWYYLERPADRETGVFKWKDWQESLDLDEIPTQRMSLDRAQWVGGRKSRIIKPWRTLRYLQQLKQPSDFSLSSDLRWREASEKLRDRLEELQQ